MLSIRRVFLKNEIKTLLTLNLLNTFLLFADTCPEGYVQLRNGSRVEYPTGYSVASGRVVVCVNGEYVDVCQGSITAQEVCTGLEYAGTVEEVKITLYTQKLSVISS